MALLIIPVWNGDRELEVCTATYEPGIDQSQHEKSVSLIINNYMYLKAFLKLLKIQNVKPNSCHNQSLFKGTFDNLNYIIVFFF